MLITDLDNCFVYDKGRHSFSFIDLTGSKSLNPVPNRNTFVEQEIINDGILMRIRKIDKIWLFRK